MHTCAIEELLGRAPNRSFEDRERTLETAFSSSQRPEHSELGRGLVKETRDPPLTPVGTHLRLKTSLRARAAPAQAVGRAQEGEAAAWVRVREGPSVRTG